MTDAKHTDTRLEYVPSTEHHGPYVTTEFGTTVCDFYAMSRPSERSTASGGPSKPIPHLAEMADANAARVVLCWNAHDDLVKALESGLEYYQACDMLAAFENANPNNSTKKWDYLLSRRAEAQAVHRAALNRAQIAKAKGGAA